jgi:hypothetical protein
LNIPFGSTSQSLHVNMTFIICLKFSEANEEEKSADSTSDNSAKEGSESEVEVKEDETTAAAAEATSEQPRGLGNL